MSMLRAMLGLRETLTDRWARASSLSYLRPVDTLKAIKRKLAKAGSAIARHLAI